MTGNQLTDDQLDRTLGVVLASAAGDALGAGYEFKPGWSGAPEPAMIGGGLGNFEPGEWTDDTTMAWAILEPASRGLDLRTSEGLTAVARNSSPGRAAGRPTSWCRPAGCCQGWGRTLLATSCWNGRGHCTNSPGARPGTGP